MVVFKLQPVSAEWSLTAEGEECATHGSSEFRVFNAIPAEGSITRAELEGKVGKAVCGIGFAHCMKQGWIAFDKATQSVSRKVASPGEDKTQQALQAVKRGEVPADINDLKRRKLVAFSTLTLYAVSKGKRFATQRREVLGELTSDLLKSGEWASKEFKEYNFDALGTPPIAGTLHPLMKVRSQFRNILLEMGFSEMPTNNYVESSFWNFDSLFQPQQHPARDAHDTFFLTQPANARLLPKEYLERVKEVHEKGGFDSLGYRYKWKEEEARKNIMRTHTTAVSSRMLYLLAQKPFRPQKWFSIDRVFRNETLDATHLCEFHQIEGWVADYNLTLGDLIGTIQTFFKKIDIPEVRFKPAYNPYTEPSMEIFGYSPVLGKWIEVGNSGIFRPEMLQPMGLPPNVRVIAWGLSLERPTMIKYGIKRIKDLFGHGVKLDIISTNPIARYDADSAPQDSL